MATTSATRSTTAWRFVVRRLLLVGLAVVAATAVLGGLLVGVAYGVEWRLPPAPELAGPTIVTDRDGNVLARFTTSVDRREVGFDEVSAEAIAAIVTSEDANFYLHDGVDPVALVRAVVANVRTGGITQGGSTLTQQYVKNAFVGDDETIRRKVEEAVLAISLERQLSKQEILEGYVNASFFGEGAYGIEAAALTYFGVTAAELDLAQGATLAQLLPAPSVRNPRNDPDGSLLRRDRLLRRMDELGTASAAAVREALDQPLGVLPREAPDVRYPYVVQHVRRLLVEAYGEETVLTGALRVRTTIDPRAMSDVRRAVREHLPRQPDRPGIDAGAMVVDPATGDVLAWHGGRSYAASTFDLTMQARRRPGSTMKPIATLAALEQGVTLDDRYPAPASFREGDLCDPGWAPGNAGGSSFGSLPLREALFRSVNTVFAQVGCDVGPDALAATATRLGVRSEQRAIPQLAIGGAGSNATVADMTQVYATLANDGIQCPLRTILEVRDRDGLRLEVPAETDGRGADRAPSQAQLDDRPRGWADDDRGRCHRMADADDVRRVTDALEEVVRSTTGTGADVGRPQAGKTGTTDDEVDAWFAGYTPDLAMVVRVGDEQEVPMRDVAGVARVQGGTIPASIWASGAAPLLEGVPPRLFLDPGSQGGVTIRSTRPPPAPSPSPTGAPSPTAEPTVAPSPVAPPPSVEPTAPEDDEGGCAFLFLGCEDP